jgi:hypothetical protein
LRGEKRTKSIFSAVLCVPFAVSAFRSQVLRYTAFHGAGTELHGEKKGERAFLCVSLRVLCGLCVPSFQGSFVTVGVSEGAIVLVGYDGVGSWSNHPGVGVDVGVLVARSGTVQVRMESSLGSMASGAYAAMSRESKMIKNIRAGNT